MIDVEKVLEQARAVYLQETSKEARDIAYRLKASINFHGDAVWGSRWGHTYLVLSLEVAAQHRLEGNLREWIETEIAIAKLKGIK